MEDFLYNNRIYYSPIEFAIAHIGGTWKMPILLSLRNGPLRYGDLKESISHISDKMLITQLRELEQKDLIIRMTYKEKPPRVEYTLTRNRVFCYACY
ncbi:winged helix-turn-helix transcriptional regulator [Pedobacter sp. NJ-S-72]